MHANCFNVTKELAKGVESIHASKIALRFKKNPFILPKNPFILPKNPFMRLMPLLGFCAVIMNTCFSKSMDWLGSAC
jgi:hypothetical protein